MQHVDCENTLMLKFHVHVLSVLVCMCLLVLCFMLEHFIKSRYLTYIYSLCSCGVLVITHDISCPQEFIKKKQKNTHTQIPSHTTFTLTCKYNTKLVHAHRLQICITKMCNFASFICVG